jgi:Protein of unknown function (DUF3307)
VIPDTTLVVVWLVFAHLVADFVLQNDWIAINKANGTSEGYRALLTHGLHVSLCLVPAVLAFGVPGLVYLVLVAVSHMLVDRWKVQATRSAEAAAQAHAIARRDQTGFLVPSGLGAAWTPWPGMLFLADQALHLTFALVGWLIILESVPLTAQWVDVVNMILRSFDRAAVHAFVLTGLVLISVFVVNTRGAYYFAMALLSPRELKPQPAADGVAQVAAPAAVAATPTNAVPVGAPQRIESTVAAFERLLIAAFVMLGSVLGVVMVVGLRVAARWRQLEDGGYVEYFLLATLASVSVAVGSALLAMAALASLA